VFFKKVVFCARLAHMRQKKLMITALIILAILTGLGLNSNRPRLNYSSVAAFNRQKSDGSSILDSFAGHILQMKAKWGALVTDGRGKIGGHVMTKNRQGAAMRTKVTPINRRSNTQQNTRSTFTGLSQAWRALTASQRSAWNSAAPDYKKSNIFGDSYAPTGKNLYMLINANILLGGGTEVSDVPASTPPNALTSFSVASLTSAAFTLAFGASPLAADNAVIIECTRPLSAGVDSAGAAYRKVTTLAPAATTPANIFTAYSNVFGAPVADKKVFVRATPVDNTTGVRATPLQASAIVS